nr:MAG TPA: hypothetical protein [Bacteriophage sp.]
MCISFRWVHYVPLVHISQEQKVHILYEMYYLFITG